MLTPDEVAVACGLQPFSDFSARLRRFADAYGCEPRRTGRTTRVLCLAIAQAKEGQRVLLRCATAALAFSALRFLRDLVMRAAARGEATGCTAEFSPTHETRHTIDFASGGRIAVATPTERWPVGLRFDSVLQDHYDPSTSARSDRACLHRVERAKRSCAACGLKLRSRKALKLARLRDRMRLADPEAWRTLGLDAREFPRRVEAAAQEDPRYAWRSAQLGRGLGYARRGLAPQSPL